jgi:hypothetical protein
MYYEGYLLRENTGMSYTLHQHFISLMRYEIESDKCKVYGPDTVFLHQVAY